MRTILHIDFNSFFATVEQQANPRLRGKPIGVTGGDRMKRTVIGAASIEAKRYGVKTGMPLWEAQKLCRELILVNGDSDKYLETTKRFLNILKDYSPYVEVFSIDECFMELCETRGPASSVSPLIIAKEIKQRIRNEIGEWISCSIGISYNKLMAKLAGSLIKPDGLVVIANPEEAMKILDKIELDEICGIGRQIKKKLNNAGIFNFATLRKVPLPALLASYKSYGQVLYNMARGLDDSPITPFYEKEEVKSVGHRHTIYHDTDNSLEIKQILLKLSELVARRLRAKQLVGKTVSFWYRNADFSGEGMQTTISYTNDGLEIFQAAWKMFNTLWLQNKIRMVGVSVSNLRPQNPETLSLLPESKRQETIIKALDKVNNKFGEFTLQRGILLDSTNIKRKPNSFLSDRRFKLP
jgi:DNA polymerase IV